MTNENSAALTASVATLTLLLLSVVSASPVSASETGDADQHFHHNDIGVFVGGTTPFNEEAGGKTAPTIGVEYERRFSPTVGAVLIAEFVGDDHKRDYLFAVQFTYRISKLRLGIGPGFELTEKDKPSGGTNLSEHFVIVTRANYVFHVGKISVAPTVGIDLIGETKTNLVYGLAVGYGF